MKTIITIGRQYGSGGREIGQKLAAHYGIKFYDNELISKVAKESGFCDDILEIIRERTYGKPETAIRLNADIQNNEAARARLEAIAARIRLEVE